MSPWRHYLRSGATSGTTVLVWGARMNIYCRIYNYLGTQYTLEYIFSLSLSLFEIVI